MWTRSLLKQNAWNNLRGTYWISLGVYFVGTLLAGLAGSIMGGIFQIFGMYAEFMDLDDGDSAVGFLGVFLIVYLLALAVAFANVFFVANPIRVGMCNFFINARGNSGRFGDLFSPFKNGKFVPTVKAMFFYYIEIFLWSLLFWIPGIIKSYEFTLVPYLLAENPNLGSKRAKEISQQTMDGEKMEFFVLQLSFIGWFCLGMLACGYGVYAVMPYYLATEAEFYACMRAKMLSYGFTTEEELGGFSGGVDASYPSSGYNESNFASNAYSVPNTGYQNPYDTPTNSGYSNPQQPVNPNDQYGGVMPGIDNVPTNANPNDPNAFHSDNDPNHPFGQ